MGWQDQIKNSKFRIQTGDGVEFFPLLKITSKSKEYNASVFDFINVPDSFVDRKKPKSPSFPLLFYFEGEDHVTQCDEFEKSADDPRFWTVEHPYYGNITGQPLNLNRNDQFLNSTEVTVDFWKTITFDKPAQEKSLPDEIYMAKNNLNQSLAIAYPSKVDLKPIDQLEIKQNIEVTDNKFSKKLVNESNYDSYKEKLGSVNSSLSDILVNPRSSVLSICDFLDIPKNGNNFASLDDIFETYTNIYRGIKLKTNPKSNKNDKAFFEYFGASVISNICQSVVSPNENDFIMRSQVENSTSKINEIYNDYTETLDTLQSPIQNSVTAFSIDYTSQAILKTIVETTTFNLFNYAFNTKQERSIELDKDCNLIVLTHRYVGLDANDQNIETFRKMNNIVNKKVFGIRKGTIIKYLV